MTNGTRITSLARKLNCYYWRPSLERLISGIQLELLPGEAENTFSPALVLGPKIRGRFIRAAKIFPVDMTKFPEGIGNDKIYAADFIEERDSAGQLTGKVEIAVRTKPGEFYVLCETGLNPNNVMASLGQMQRKFTEAGGVGQVQLREHNVFAMHQGQEAVRVTGVDEKDLGQEAEELWSFIGRKAGMGKFVPFILKLYRVFPNSALIAHDIDGTIGYAVGREDEVEFVKGNAANHGEFLTYLEESRAAA